MNLSSKIQSNFLHRSMNENVKVKALLGPQTQVKPIMQWKECSPIVLG